MNSRVPMSEGVWVVGCCGLTSLRFCCAANVVTASEAREPDVYRDCSNRVLDGTRCGSADKLVIKPCKRPAENESVDDSIEYEQTS